MNITQATWKKARRGAGVPTCAGETAKNIFSQKYNSSHFLFIEIEARRAAGERGKERASIGQAGIERG